MYRNKLDNDARSFIVPEDDEGSREYKLKLLDKSPERFEQIKTQMRYRMDEGQGECIYVLGVTDNGGVVGLTSEEYKETYSILAEVARQNSYKLSLLTEQVIDSVEDGVERKMYEFLVREHNENKYIDIKVACSGSVDAGKSTLLGVMLTGKNDDGRGTARLNVFNLPHEIKSGRTSSVGHQIMGFDGEGNVVNYNNEMHGRKKGWPEIVRDSDKIVTFFDLCGHEKYLKTTIIGLTSQFPDVSFILVGANMGITKMTKEHIFLCLTLRIPFVIIVTKIDICLNRPQVLKDTVQSVKRLLKKAPIRRIPYDVKTTDDVVLCSKNIHSYSTVPMFYVSNVTGQGIDYVKQFLNLFNKKPLANNNVNKVEYHIEQTFQVTGVGTVIGGQLISGTIKIGDKLLLGPVNDSYQTVQIKSLHCKRVSVDEVDAGRYVCIALRKIDRDIIRRGHVMISPLDNHIQVREFEAEISVLQAHSTTIKLGYEPVLHTCSIRQTAKIIGIRDKQCGRKQNSEDAVLRTGDRAKVTFRFCYKPEYIKPGYRLLLAEGRVKIIGKVLSVKEEIVPITGK